MPNIQEEIWKDIPGFEGVYQISSFGRVLSAKRNGTKGGILIPKLERYYFVNLKYKGKETTKRIHCLLAQAFIPNPENKPTVNHIDGNKLNNAITNLEWATQKEQMAHVYRIGLRCQLGSKNKMAKLTESQISEIKQLLYQGISQRIIAQKYGVIQQTISLISTGKNWKHLRQSEQTQVA